MKIFLETYGCTTNQVDSNILKQQLSTHEFVSEKEADLILLNTCTVKGTTESKILHRIKNTKKPLLVCGCMAQVQEKQIKNANKKAHLLGITNLESVSQAVDEIGTGKKAKYLERTEIDKAQLEHSKPNSIDFPISISDGCLGSCTFCITRLARGELKSFDPGAIISQAETAISSGYREIRITAQDTGIYGTDIETDFPSLLSSLSSLPREFRVRVGMMNPNGAKKILGPLIKAYQSEKIYKFLHIPVQSGSNKVLKEMNRPYTITDFKNIAARFRKAYPNLALATDIIVAYPTETEKDFEKTVQLLKDVKPDVINISRFASRPGTEAAKLDKIPTEVAKERSRKITALADKISIKNNKKYVGKHDLILLTEKGKGGTVVGKASNYKSVVLDKGKLGLFYQVKFTEAHSAYLKAVSV
ncbi:tRNA (N(6)-L-threonylcarbamoyladenosine(37)-C(2))-methylthiotransferase [Candidatus Undinarchaeota archaeon]